MRLVLAAIGSRGDAAPCAHLAGRLVAEGHEVALLTHATYADLAPPGVGVVGVDSDPAALLAGPAARALRRGNVWALNDTRDVFAAFLQAAHEPALRALVGADGLVASTFALAPVHVALERGVPVVRAHMWPEFAGGDDPLAAVPYASLAPRPVRRVARRGLHRLSRYLGGVEGRWSRGRLHLTARHPVTLTTATAGSLYAFSPTMLSGPPPEGVVTGWWTPPARAVLSPETAQALASGGEWIYVGFGSMHQRDPGALLALVDAACRRLGVRAVVQLGEARGTPHPNLLCVGEEPHEELLSRVAAAVHHGGAGTTGSVVRAGTPSVVVPHFADQFYWAGRLDALGVAARPLPRRRLTADRLARRLETALTPPVRVRAAALARVVSAEDGPGRAVRQLERWLTDPGAP